MPNIEGKASSIRRHIHDLWESLSPAERRLGIGLTIAFLFRFLIILLPGGFWGDISCFKGWSAAMAQHGPGGFYYSIWCDYPPAYLYLLGLWGKLYQVLFDPAFHTLTTAAFPPYTPFNSWIKFPPIVADVLGAFVLYGILKGQVGIPKASRTALFYAFNLVLILDSANWGQMDGVSILVMLLTAQCLIEEKLVPAALLGTLGVLIKPQGLFILPLFLFTQWFRHGIRKWLAATAASLALAWVLIFPVVPNKARGLSIIWQPFLFLWGRMEQTAGNYPFGSINAFNSWFYIGNLRKDSLVLFGLSIRTWGLVFIVVLISVLSIAYYRFRQRGAIAFFLAASLLMVGFFLLPTRMHERYILMALPFLAISAALDPRFKVFYWGFSLTSLLNVCCVLLNYAGLVNVIFTFVSVWGNLAMFAGLLVSSLLVLRGAPDSRAETGDLIRCQLE